MIRSFVAVAAMSVTACATSTPPTTTPSPAPAPPAVVTPPTPPTTAPPPTTTAPPTTPTPAFTAEGYYELRLTFGGTAIPVTLELWKENGAWRGIVSNANLGSANVTRVETDGRWFKATAVATNGPTFVFEIEVLNDLSVKGTWTGNGDGSAISGRKVP